MSAPAAARWFLVCATPPGSGNVGELFLRDLVRHLGPERVDVAALLAPEYALPPNDPGMPVAMPVVSAQMRPRRRGHGAVSAFATLFGTLTGMHREAARIEGLLVRRARERGAERLLVVLDNPLAMLLAHRLARRLRLPLATIVWDAPGYLLQKSGFDRFSRALLLRQFNRSLAASSRVAVVSEAMRDLLRPTTSAPIEVLRHGVDAAAPAPHEPCDEPEWLLGFAGAMYSQCAWRALLAALDSVDWRIAGRPLRLRLLTSRIILSSKRAARVDFLGRLPTPEDAARELARCDLSYLPQPFAPHLRDVARYSFPTKLTAYLATGKPVFVHAPADAAISDFYRKHPMGAMANSTDATAIVSALESLLSNPALYSQAAREVGRLAREQFSAQAFGEAADSALGIEAAGA